MIGDTAEKKKKVTRNWTKNLTRERPGRKKKGSTLDLKQPKRAGNRRGEI
jgi:hypothetical protein